MLLITDEGKPEKVPTAEALKRAQERELDLIEVSGKTNPPVVKIGDYGHYLYQVQKKERKQRSRSKQTEVKTLRCGFKTEQHDLDRILRRAEEFFEERHLVKIVLRLRGRELSNPGYAREKLLGLIRSLEGKAEVEQELKRQGNQFIVVLRPKR